MDELNALKKSDLKAVLAAEGYSQDDIDWSYKRNNAEGLRVIIRNSRTHAIISQMTRQAGREMNK